MVLKEQKDLKCDPKGEKMPTPHNNAEKKDIAKNVLMPGDPLRAKFIAEHFLENSVLVNSVRGINGYTGTYNGKPVTVIGKCGGKIVAMESALALTKPAFSGIFDIVLAVRAPEELRVKRACERDGVDEAAVRERIRNQSVDVSAADYIIDNDGTPEDLRAKTEAVLREIQVVLSKMNDI